MDRRKFLSAGVSGAAAASLLAANTTVASAQTASRNGTAEKPIRIFFLDKAPMRVAQERLYDPTAIEKQLNAYASPGTRITIGFPDNFDGSQVGVKVEAQSKLNGLDHMMALPKLIEKIFWAQEQGYDAVVSSNTFDPGVEGGRLAVTIPVIGLFRTSMHAALTLADRIAITVPVPSHIPYARRLLRAYGLESFVSDIRAIDIYGQDVKGHEKAIFDTTAKLIKSIVDETGAQLVVPLGGALIPYVVNPDDLAKATGVPVLNTKAIAIRFAETCVALGMTQSPAAYPHPNLTMQDFKGRRQ